MTQAALDGQPSSWLGTLIGALPFLLFGPSPSCWLTLIPTRVAHVRRICGTGENHLSTVMLIGLRQGGGKLATLVVPLSHRGHRVFRRLDRQLGRWIAQSVAHECSDSGRMALFGQLVHDLTLLCAGAGDGLCAPAHCALVASIVFENSTGLDTTLIRVVGCHAFMLSGADYDEDPRLTWPSSCRA